MSERPPMRCMWKPSCARDVSRDRPVQIEAICWRCWYEAYGKAQAVREWKREHWWRRFVP